MGKRETPSLLKVFVDASALQASLGDIERKGGGLSPEQTQLLLLAEARDHGYVDFVTTAEAQMELVEPEGGGELLYGAPIAPAKLPQAYRQALADAARRDEDMVLEVLRTLGAPRYLELRDLGGAEDLTRRTLFNALSLWCAEESGCEVLLTSDSDFRTRAGEAAVGAVAVAEPGEVLEVIGHRIGRWRTFWFLLKGRKRVRQALG